MNRRSFLGLGLAALATATLDPERLAWEPGQRTFFDLHTRGNDDWVFANGVLRKFDIVTFEGHYARNPETGLITPHLQQFMITDVCPAGPFKALLYPLPERVPQSLVRAARFPKDLLR